MDFEIKIFSESPLLAYICHISFHLIINICMVTTILSEFWKMNADSSSCSLSAWGLSEAANVRTHVSVHEGAVDTAFSES